MDLLDKNNPELEADIAKLGRFSLQLLPPGVDQNPKIWEAKNQSLVRRIDRLLEKYPAHPDLLELRALFCQDSLEALNDFRRAIASASERGFHTFTLRMHIAFLLINAFMDDEGAKAELDVALPELRRFGDTEQRAKYANLLASLESIREGIPCNCGALLKALKDPRCPSCGQRL